MGRAGSWVVRTGAGFGRACVGAAVCMLVPVVWAVAVGLGVWCGAEHPWSWIGPAVIVCAGTLALAQTVCRAVRFLVARWTGTDIPAGYREAGPVMQLSTGYWWNGFSYERSRRDAVMDQRMRLWWSDPATWRDLRFVVIAPLTAGVVAALPPAALAVAVIGLARPETVARPFGACALLLAVGCAPYAWRSLHRVAVRFLRPSPAMVLAERVDELTSQRADATVAQAAEIRRIERDLHDGAQARLVALGLSLATAERLMDRDPEQAKALMREARAGAAASLTELRELIRGISPPVLSERGLVDAVRALALDVPLDVAVRAGGPLRLDPPIESAVYFGVAELLTNAVKHAGAGRAHVSLVRDDTGLVVEVEDDGRGGADVRPGGGLAGLRRRLAAFDGTLAITSPQGGPTHVRMAVPCE
ncbi:MULTISPECIES: sensor histidine kinase [unclassified Streptomyces]|uniref:sensor histidine kinase n=1 Tax=unclassified Streptomyces TaxID=2593676 RepID=UPI002E0D77C1|nr:MULTISPECIES: sensor histidine kinase [unclassified Streptomyces]WSR23255.1 sensor histidine kinase [Streptomyces sp. NBC_01205]